MSDCAFCGRPYQGELCPRCSGAVDVEKVLGVLERKKPPLPPREIGRFRIVRPLGEGGTGIVYEALDPVLGRSVALKILKPQGLGPELVERFLREARFLARLRHPNVVQIYELGRHENRDFLTMEFIDGAPFPGTSERREIVGRLARVARALGHIHRRSIVHRDLKPSNILVDPAGRPVVMDFGIARSAEAVSTLSLAGTLVGTPAYMAPEQFSGETADARTDVWALGVILYEALAGRRPFDGRTVVALAEQVRAGRAPAIPDVPRELDAVIRRAMATRPDDRYPGADAMAEALERLLSGRRPRPRLAPRLKWALGGAAAGLLFVGAMALLRPLPAPPEPPAGAVDTRPHLEEGLRLSLQGRFEAAHAAFDRAGDRREAWVAKGEMTLSQQFALHADRLHFPQTVRALAERLAATQGPAFDRLAARPDSAPLARLYAHVARGQWSEARREAQAVDDPVLRDAIGFFVGEPTGGLRAAAQQRRESDGLLGERDVWRVYQALPEYRTLLARFPHVPGPRRTSAHAALLRVEGMIFEAKGDGERALEVLARATAAAPEYLPARLARARLLGKLGRPREAEVELDAARRQAKTWGLSLPEADLLLR